MTPVVERFAGESAEWDAFGAGRRGWTAYHGYRWKRIMEEVMGHECPYLAARDSAGQLSGVLPLVRVRSLAFGRYLVSMPFLNYGGPLGTDRVGSRDTVQPTVWRTSARSISGS